jgi:hypothetical protein
MAPAAFRAQHCHGTGDDTDEPERDMDSRDHSDKYRIGGRNLDA